MNYKIKQTESIFHHEYERRNKRKRLLKLIGFIILCLIVLAI